MDSTDPRESRRTEGQFLPDFCSAGAVLAVVLLAELFAILLTLARHESGLQFWQGLARISLFLLWSTLLSAGMLCIARPLLARLGTLVTSMAAMVIVLGCVALISTAAWSVGRAWPELPSLLVASGTGGLADFLWTNLLIAAIVTSLILRYFWVTAQWRRNVEAGARSRIQALQARIRPHFLFNSMNTIAALTRSAPALAEEAVEDLADLFRASLSDAASMVTLKEEFELSRVYQRIEQHRLGSRLGVEWHVASLPLRARVPALSIQPLLENAIYHGIEELSEGGTVVVEGNYDTVKGVIELAIENPLPEDMATRTTHREGNRIAVENLRQRFELAWGARASVQTGTVGGRYRVVLRFPAELSS